VGLPQDAGVPWHRPPTSFSASPAARAARPRSSRWPARRFAALRSRHSPGVRP